MRFVRITYGRTTQRVVAVFEQDVPFTTGGYAIDPHEECDVVDLGVAEDQAWTDLDGKKCGPTLHILQRLEAGFHHDVEKLHACPCTIDAIKARLGFWGTRGIPVKVRAWLANVLPEHQVAQMGLARGLPISVMKAAEAMRNRRDPKGGSRMPQLEAIAQRQSDERALMHLRARQAKEANS
jgi:hypothetical protein